MAKAASDIETVPVTSKAKPAPAGAIISATLPVEVWVTLKMALEPVVAVSKSIRPEPMTFRAFWE